VKGIKRLTAEQLRGCRGVTGYEIRGQWLVITMAGGEQRKASLASVCQDLGRRLSWHPSTGYSKRRPPPEPEQQKRRAQRAAEEGAETARFRAALGDRGPTRA
jgi:hypothetical protein